MFSARRRITPFEAKAASRSHELIDQSKVVSKTTLRRKAREQGCSWPNAKRVYRVMKQHDLLLQRHTGAAGERRHDGQITVEGSNTRWCSDGFEITYDNRFKIRVAFALDCCDREAIAHVPTPEGIKSEDVQDLVITAVENRFGGINMLA